jgi:hypothetical protein
MHTRAMRTATSVRRPVRGLLALAVAGTLALSGCSGDSDEPAAGSGSGSASASAKPYLPVPDGVELTPPGTQLKVGERATVAYEPRQGKVGVLSIKVYRLEKTSFRQSFAGWKLDDATKKTNPYFVRAKVSNVGDTNLGGRNVPLYIVDGKNTLIEASSFASTFKPCPVGEFPKKFKNGDSVSVCLVYLSPDHGKLTAASFRPTQEFAPITWTGDLTGTKAAEAKKSAQKSAEKSAGGNAKKSTEKKG